jgi:uncharacterized membrane protein
MGKSRLEAFSDGVFAIVVTVLVLDIRLPALGPGAHSAALLAALAALLPKILSFVLSFAFATTYWVNHHHFFQTVRHANRTLLWLNSLFLLTLVFIPFPTSLLGEYPTEPVALAVFGAVVAVIGTAFGLLRWYATEVAHLTGPAPSHVRRRSRLRGNAGPILYIFGGGAGFLQPLLPWAVFRRAHGCPPSRVTTDRAPFS